MFMYIHSLIGKISFDFDKLYYDAFSIGFRFVELQVPFITIVEIVAVIYRQKPAEIKLFIKNLTYVFPAKVGIRPYNVDTIGTAPFTIPIFKLNFMRWYTLLKKHVLFSRTISDMLILPVNKFNKHALLNFLLSLTERI